MHDFGAREGTDAAAPDGPREPGDRHETPLLSRRTVGVALAGAAAGLACASVLGGTRWAAAGAAAPAELTAVETAAAPTATTTFRLFGTRKGPTTAKPTGSKGLITGLIFEVKTGGCWLEGYWYWVCHKGQSTKPQKFALWLPYPTAHAPKGQLVPGSTVTSKKLVAGKWNFIRLPKPLALSISTQYVLVTGSVGGVPVTGNVWAKGKVFGKGVTKGPLYAPPTGSDGMGQCPVTVGSNPAKVMPIYGGYPAEAYYWLDLQVSTKAPAGASYRLWPSMPLVVAPPKTLPDTKEQSAGTEFRLSTNHKEYKLDKIWFFSPPANSASGIPKAKLLPSSCAIFDIATKAPVPGTLRGSAGPNPKVMPNWRNSKGLAAKPGDGWVYVSYSSVRLPPGRYKTAIYAYAGGTVQSNDYIYFTEQTHYFGPNGKTPAVAPNGITNGPLSSPRVSTASLANSNGSVPGAPATLHGNSTYQDNDATNTGTFLYPDTFDDEDNGETRWVDVEVTPVV